MGNYQPVCVREIPTCADQGEQRMSQSNFPKPARPLIFAGLALLLMLGIGAAVYNSGWSQGYLMGLLSGSADGVNLTPYLIARGGGGQGGFGFFGFVGAIFRIFFFVFFFVFLFGLIFKMIYFRRHWRQGGHAPWHRHGGWGAHQGWGEQWGKQEPQQGSQQEPPPAASPLAQPQRPDQPIPPGPQPTGWTQV
jgi:hypothetical protein